MRHIGYASVTVFANRTMRQLLKAARAEALKQWRSEYPPAIAKAAKPKRSPHALKHFNSHARRQKNNQDQVSA